MRMVAWKAEIAKVQQEEEQGRGYNTPADIQADTSNRAAAWAPMHPETK